MVLNPAAFAFCRQTPENVVYNPALRLLDEPGLD